MQKNIVGIAGAGSMGKQLALLFASNGFSVVLWNHRSQPGFHKAFSQLVKVQSRLGYVSKEKISGIIDSVIYTNNLDAMQSCSFVIEAVSEDNDIKSSVLMAIDSIASNAKVIATNTSTLSITELASFIANPSRLLGAHFFNPPVSMDLVEVIKGELTSDDSLDFMLQVLEVINKTAVVLPETPGFVVNRLLFPMINEAIFLLSEGVSDAKTIDTCMKLGANHPMGPLELADFIGLDICLSILNTLVKESGDSKYRPAPLLKKYVRAGKLGKKSGVGFYAYRRKG